MRILVITGRIPYPPTRGAAIRIYNLLKRLASDHQVWIVAFSKATEDQHAIEHLLTFCEGVETVETVESRGSDRPLEAIKYLALGRPIELRHHHSRELVDTIKRLVARINFDIVDIEDSFMGLYLEALPSKLRRKSVLTLHDVVFSKYDRIWRLEPKLRRRFRLWLHSRMMRRWEPAYVGGFARCITVSESDRELLLARNARLKIDVVPNGIDTKQYTLLPLPPRTPGLVFVGNMGYRPNMDAMLYFCREVYPQIKGAIPDLELWITGIDPPQEIQDLAGDGIHVTGTVDDVRPFYERTTVSIVPLRAGGGTRLKILESMALGRPVVSTSIGCEGLEVVDGKHLFVADTADQFAKKTLRLLKDEQLRQSIVQQARELAVSRYDWDVITNGLLHTYAEVAK